MNICIVGIGLIGGSLAKAINNLGSHTVFGIDNNEKILNAAIKEKVIHKAFLDGKEILPICDIVILCIYPKDEIKFIKQNLTYFKQNAIITDVSGLKTRLVDEAREVLSSRDDISFISAHPMTGKEINGLENSDGNLFVNCNYIIIQDDKNHSSLHTIEDLIKSIGAKNIIYSSPKEHDTLIGYTSHLPHILAVSLCMDDYFNVCKKFIGRSFKDVSRVAEINEDLWSELFIENKENLLDSIERFKKNLNILEKVIKNEDEASLRELLKKSRIRKNALGE